jgi:16S rRNA U516 pseudouridylate synthase RsuA-like enzyme
VLTVLAAERLRAPPTSAPSHSLRPATGHPRFTDADLDSGDALAEIVYAIHKPRGVLSAVGETHSHFGSGGRRTLTDVMLDAEVEPLPGHVGRLDAETSGLILVTSHSLLLRAALAWPEVLDAHGGQPLAKRYELLVAGRHVPGAESLAALCAPLSFERGGKTYEADPALRLTHRGCVQDAALATEYEFIDRSEHEQATVAEAREALRARRRPARSRATGELVPPWTPEDGWLTRVELEIAQGRHHQVRRLCKAAGLKLRHLRRLAVGPVSLDGLCVGGVRVLGRDEKRTLYSHCLPRLLAAQDADRAARERTRPGAA